MRPGNDLQEYEFVKDSRRDRYVTGGDQDGDSLSAGSENLGFLKKVRQTAKLASVTRSYPAIRPKHYLRCRDASAGVD